MTRFAKYSSLNFKAEEQKGKQLNRKKKKQKKLKAALHL